MRTPGSCISLEAADMSLRQYIHSVWKRSLNTDNNRGDIVQKELQQADIEAVTKLARCRSSGNMNEIKQHADMSRPMLTRSRSAHTKRMLSVTDLLEKTKNNFSQFFPVIDIKKYQSNAPFAIYDTEVRDATDEIAAYFGERLFTRTCSTSSTMSTVYVGPKPSLSSMSSFHLPEMRTMCEDIAEDDGSLCSDDGLSSHSDSNSDTSDVEQCHKETHVLLNSPLLTRVQKKLIHNYPDAIWFACHIELLPITSRLSISVKRFLFPNDKTESGSLEFFAKICILPGNFKKQRVRVVPALSADFVTPKVYYHGISCAVLTNLKIHIKICMKRGFLKRSKVIKELVVGLDATSLQSVWTALAKVSKEDL